MRYGNLCDELPSRIIYGFKLEMEVVFPIVPTVVSVKAKHT